MFEDTIAAISTPVGRGGIGILRISGKLVPIISTKLVGKVPEPRKAEYLPFLSENGSVLERVIVLFFPEPNSFTGENVLEVHSHGGQMILDVLLNRILEVSTGIRLANPGEFTERAFLNDKIDLLQAEAVADIIDATSHQAAKSASNSLQGIFSKKINMILEKIVDLRSYIELFIDFSEEDIENVSFEKIQNLLEKVIEDVNYIYKSASYGVLLKDGLKLVIAGKPNAGKSSLFNTLIGSDRAIVSSISGTTRDILREYTHLGGIPCYITDTAGLIENSSNEVERIGIRRAWAELKKADHILWIVDSSNILDRNCDSVLDSIKKVFFTINKELPITVIYNKSDLSLKTVGIHVIQGYTFITVSVFLNEGIDLLRKYLFDTIQSQIKGNFGHCFAGENQGNFIARKRHLDILKRVSHYLLSAKNKLNDDYDIFLIAEDLRFAHDELNKIIGKFISDEVLKKIFSTFCIGK